MNKYTLTIALLLFTFQHLPAQDLSQLKGQKPFSLDGSIAATTNFYTISGKESTRDPFSYVLTGNVNVSVYNVQLPFSFIYSNNNFNYAQPFNRFGVSPEYKWIKLHLGHRNVSFSPLTLGGHSFLGAGAELNPGNFRFGAVYGRFNQKTIPNTVNPLDTLQTPTRNGYSVKMGIGSPSNYFDLIFLKIADDSSSFDNLQFAPKIPQSNSVVGAHMKFTLFKFVTWETEGAISLLTKDLLSQTPFETDNALLESAIGFFQLNASSEYSTALTSSLNYSKKMFALGLQYRRIDPNYQSFGAYYFNTDIENLTLNTKFRLFKNKLSINGNIGLQNDNLNNNKAARSTRVISMANVNYSTGKAFSINGSFSNYSIDQQPGRLPLNDTIKLYQNNRNITLTPMLSFNNRKTQQMIQLNLVLMDLTDFNIHTSANSEVNSRMGMLNYFLNHVNSGINLMAGISYTSMASAYSNQRLYGVNANAGKSFLKGKMNTNIGLALNRSLLDNSEGWMNTATAMITYKPHSKHLFKLNFNYLQNLYPENSTSRSFNETKIIFSYVYKF